MAEMTIRLRIDPVTGKKNIVIAYHSDADALPQEHEQAHKDLVQKLVGKGLLGEDEVGAIVVEREEKTPASAQEEKPNQTPQKQSVKA